MCFLHLLLKKKKEEKKKTKKKKKKKKKEKKKEKKKKETKRKETEFSCENPGNWHNVNSNFDWKTKSHWPIKILKKTTLIKFHFQVLFYFVQFSTNFMT
jgi:hypothetical protein